VVMNNTFTLCSQSLLANEEYREPSHANAP
jgi:hypothetical protein